MVNAAIKNIQKKSIVASLVEPCLLLPDQGSDFTPNGSIQEVLGPLFWNSRFPRNRLLRIVSPQVIKPKIALPRFKTHIQFATEFNHFIRRNKICASAPTHGIEFLLLALSPITNVWRDDENSLFYASSTFILFVGAQASIPLITKLALCSHRSNQG